MIVALTVVVVLALLVPTSVCALKGKWALAIFGLVSGVGWVFAVAGALRLAKPDSSWSRRFYDDQKLERARARFVVDAEVEDERDGEILEAWAGEDIDPAELDRTTRRALRRAGRL